MAIQSKRIIYGASKRKHNQKPLPDPANSVHLVVHFTSLMGSLNPFMFKHKDVLLQQGDHLKVEIPQMIFDKGRSFCVAISAKISGNLLRNHFGTYPCFIRFSKDLQRERARESLLNAINWKGPGAAPYSVNSDHMAITYANDIGFDPKMVSNDTFDLKPGTWTFSLVDFVLGEPMEIRFDDPMVMNLNYYTESWPPSEDVDMVRDGTRFLPVAPPS